MSIRTWIIQRERRGVVCFSRSDVQRAFPEKGYNVIGSELSRLCAHGELANVYNGFFVRVPVRYFACGEVPPEYYIDQLMNHIGRPYYVSLLSAAQVFGAGHQAPQRFCVFTTRPAMGVSEKKNPAIFWGYRREIPKDLLIRRNGETSSVCFSNPELTAVDLVQYSQYVGGLSRCATVLSELMESVDFASVAPSLLNFASASSLQRLGFIVEEVLSMPCHGEALFRRLSELKADFHWTALSRNKPLDSTMPRSFRWRVIRNTEIEVDDL